MEINFLVITWVGILGNVFAAEPMMDSGLFGVSRMQAVNQINEGKFNEAILAEEKALKIAQDRYGPVHPSLVIILNDLASLHRYLAEYEKAEEETKWGLAIGEKNLGPRDLTVADSKEQLAALYNDLGRFQEAEILEKEALSIRQENSLSTPAALAQTLELLGRIEINLRNFNLAQSLIAKAIEAQNKNTHPDPNFTLHLLNSQAETYQLEGLIPKTEFALQRVLEFAQKNFSSDIHVADALENLGDFYRSQNQDEKAKPLYESALKIDKPLVGTYMEYSALPYMKRLAKASLAVGDTKFSETLWQRSLATEKKVFGPRHPQVALDLDQLAQVEWALGEKPKTRKDLEESLEILKAFFPDDHPLVVQVQNHLDKFKN